MSNLEEAQAKAREEATIAREKVKRNARIVSILVLIVGLVFVAGYYLKQ